MRLTELRQDKLSRIVLNHLIELRETQGVTAMTTAADLAAKTERKSGDITLCLQSLARGGFAVRYTTADGVFYRAGFIARKQVIQ